MNLLAVNISKELSKKGAIDATERAWKLNENNFRENLPEFVIGVASGKIHGHYKFQNVHLDVESNRLKFSLIECDVTEKSLIDSFTKDKNLKYFVTKKKW